MPGSVRPRAARVRGRPGSARATLSASLRYLAPAASATRPSSAGWSCRRMVGARRRGESTQIEPGAGSPLRSVACALDGSSGSCAVCVDNRTPAPSGLDRAGALARSLLSTHPIVRVSAAGSSRRSSSARTSREHVPGARDAEADDAVVGAAIVLPDHPQIAPESRGGLFDSTEIEEALLLHVQVLSDDGARRDRAPGPGRPRDDRARGGGDARGDHRAARPHVAARSARPRAADRARRAARSRRRRGRSTSTARRSRAAGRS